jgi:nucleotide-binding universal stress UspA family protein
MGMSTPAFRHIVCPVDFSECSERALELALDLARTNDARLTLVHVAYTPPIVHAAAGEWMYWPVADLERTAESALDELCSKAKQRYANVEQIFATGKPWRKILEIALKADADLIVMGTHGRTGVAHALLGSIAEKIVRLSPVPVLTACLDGLRKAQLVTSENASEKKRVAAAPAEQSTH